MTIDQHISNLLYHHNCVIVPDLGGFITNYRGALVSTSKNSIHPPTKKIAFNARLIENDGLLVNEVSQRENISYTQAFDLVNNFVENISAELNSGKRITVQNIGLLFLDDEKSIQFYPETLSNFLTDSFGLSSVHAVQIEKEKRNEEKIVPAEYEFRSQPSTEKKKYWKLAEVIPVVALLLFMIMYPQKIREVNSGIASIVDFDSRPSLDITSEKNDFLSQRNAENFQLQQKIKAALGDGTKKFQPVAEGEKQIVESTIPIEKTEEHLADKKVVEKNYKVIAEEQSNNYFIIVGSFKIEDNANNFVTALKQKGYDATIPGKRHGLFMVSCFSSNSDEQLQNELQKIQSSVEAQAWIYKANTPAKAE